MPGLRRDHRVMAMPLILQTFGVEVYKPKTLFLQIADNVVQALKGGGAIIVEY